MREISSTTFAKVFPLYMSTIMHTMWTQKLGLKSLHPEMLNELLALMEESEVDFTIFFRELSDLPEDIAQLARAFYRQPSTVQNQQWQAWLDSWRRPRTTRSEP